MLLELGCAIYKLIPYALAKHVQHVNITGNVKSQRELVIIANFELYIGILLYFAIF